MDSSNCQVSKPKWFIVIHENGTDIYLCHEGERGMFYDKEFRVEVGVTFQWDDPKSDPNDRWRIVKILDEDIAERLRCMNKFDEVVLEGASSLLCNLLLPLLMEAFLIGKECGPKTIQK